MKLKSKQNIFTGGLLASRKRAIRRQFLESVSTVVSILALIALPISLARVPQTGLHPNHISHMAVSVLAFVVFFTRKRLGDRWIIFCILFIFSVSSLSAFIQYGLASAGFYFATAAIIVSSAAMGIRAGIICAGLFGVAISVIGYLWISGFLIFPGDANHYLLLPTVWGTLGIAFLITMAILFISAPGFFFGLAELADEIDGQKRDVEERTAELTRVNQELEKALKDVKMLSGLLPICSHCKKIRDDQGYWQQVEMYVQDHSQAKFSHGLCPDCLKELYPDVAKEVLEEEE